MKGEPENEIKEEVTNKPAPIVGDVIGDTAYSERFVLKLLLKVANRDTLLQALKEPFIEQELCTLWDMTAERDVVLYLLKHEALNLFTFALPVIDSSRIIEIIVGIMANMCCHQEAVNTLMAKENLLVLLSDFLKSDDSDILTQLFRLINSGMYECDESKLLFWLKWFKSYDYAETLYFILKNSSNKDLLMAALENLNTICSNSESDGGSSLFSEMFVTAEATSAVHIAHSEYCKLADLDENLVRLHIICLQMILHLTQRQPDDKALETKVFDNSASAIDLLHDIFERYERKINDFHKIDSEFNDILHAVVVFTKYFETGSLCGPEKYFNSCFKMWKTLVSRTEKKCDELSRENFVSEIIKELTVIMCSYMCHCSDENLLKVLSGIGDAYKDITDKTEYSPKIETRVLNIKQHTKNNCADSTAI